MAQIAEGTFDVHSTPQPADETAGATPNRLLMAKRYHGDLEATAAGQMLSVLTEVEGSAGYVAIERVSGTLGGRRGAFALQHYGLMARGATQLTITVVPDSGTDELAGLYGQMEIRIEDGTHFYTLEYAFGED